MQLKAYTDSLSLRLVSRILWGIVWLFSAVISAFAFVSYSPKDAAFNVASTEQVTNWAGPGGALIADGLFTVFGAFALLFPFFCLWRALRAFGESNANLTGIKTAIFLLFSLGIMPLADAYLPWPKALPFLPAGFVGHLFYTVLYGAFADAGVFSVSASLWGAALICYVWSRRMAKKTSYDAEKNEAAKSEQENPWKTPATAETSMLTVRVGDDKNAQDISAREPPLSILPLAVATDDAGTSTSPQLIIKPPMLDAEPAALTKKEDRRPAEHYTLPPVKLLDYDAPQKLAINSEALRMQAQKLENAFAQFGIEGRIREIQPGPVVTLFEFVPSPGIKLSRIASLADDIAMAMEATHVRIVAPIPGKGAVGIEIPGERRETVFLKEIVAHDAFLANAHPLWMAVGKTIEGKPYFFNLAEMPHVLIAGTTGSGKSVSMNAMICSVLYRASPSQVRFLMIDPKMLELGIYEGIPHLLMPPIIDPKKAAHALRWAVAEMERRYAAMNSMGVRDLEGLNEKIKIAGSTAFDAPVPYIVIVIDEYADLITVAGRDVESLVMRLAQKARASGIHVMLATQRPSVDIITGVIKANFPVRMGFRLASSHDSKTIINRSGAEKLLGRGDMLLIPPGSSDVVRVHGAFISEKELVRVVEFWKTQGKPAYDSKLVDAVENAIDADDDAMGGSDDGDDKYAEAVAMVRRTQKCSASWLQRQLGVGYNRAAKLVERMEREGVVGAPINARGDREITGSTTQIGV
jgi:S-DNA-T family DNA segregation ATPase FtsK/SpoIIIE